MTDTRIAGMLRYETGHLLERLENPAYPANLGRLRPVGGHAKGSETKLETLTRELFEELGFILRPSMLRGEWKKVFDQERRQCTWLIEVVDHGLVPGKYDKPEHCASGDPYVQLVYQSA